MHSFSSYLSSSLYLPESWSLHFNLVTNCEKISLVPRLSRGESLGTKLWKISIAYLVFMSANTMHCPCDRMHDSCEYIELALCNLRSHYAYFNGLATYLCCCVKVQSVWLNMFSQMLWSSSNKVLNNVLWNAYSVQIAYYITLTVICSDRCWAL